MTTKTIILIILAVIITATTYGIYTANNSQSTESSNETVSVSEKTTSTEQPQDQPTEKRIVGTYTNYTEALAKQAVKDNKVVLFFHAAWCPTCRTLDKTLLKETIPEGVAIFKIDYDQGSTLKEKYRVTRQHTLVLIDENLEEIKKWSGSRNSKDIVSQIQ